MRSRMCPGRTDSLQICAPDAGYSSLDFFKPWCPYDRLVVLHITVVVHCPADDAYGRQVVTSTNAVTHRGLPLEGANR